METSRILIFVNGTLPDPEAARRVVRPDDVLLAADGGALHAYRLGFRPSVVLGDLDSLDEPLRRELEAAGTIFLTFPRTKDETDLELALKYALQRQGRAIVLVGALGGRLDQTLANLALLSQPRLAEWEVRCDDGVEEVFFVRSRAEVDGVPGEVISLLPWGRPVTGIRTWGLRWALQGETLYPDRTRGISNEFVEEKAVIEIQSGLLLVVHRRS
ncbi:MAG: thiamine diphosphokinase [Anaerolineales bacterium]|nr:thiamine diphosphokinase [Anaerolineales bacterium]MCX7607818.1 thiamine diphosphokinase [Anaerolineales bacterium]MDW8227294.1 thiamine diphosphokinase [Anaerolineales bacterium]